MDEAEDVSRLTLAAYLCYQDGGPGNGAPAGPGGLAAPWAAAAAGCLSEGAGSAPGPGAALTRTQEVRASNQTFSQPTTLSLVFQTDWVGGWVGGGG